MSFYGGIWFFICLFILLIPAVILKLKEKKSSFYTLFLSCVFIVLIYKSDMSQMLYLIAFVVLQIYIIKLFLYLRQKNGKNSFVYFHAIAFSILPLILAKVTPLFNQNIFGFLGISYITFKAVQVIIEIQDGIIKEFKIYNFLNFVLFFPSLSSGPIDRSRRFDGDLNRIIPKSEYIEMVSLGVHKIILGIVYKFALSMIFFDLMSQVNGSMTILKAVLYAYYYGFYMFFDFAGYSLMAIGVSYILGIKTPDNFNKPFISVNISDFWNRWHITLSHWLRDFVFTRFMMYSIKKKLFSSKLTGAFCGFLVNMLVMGFWHGISPCYILYGLYHGLLLGFSEIYHKKSKFYAKHKDNKVYKIFSWFITINAVMFGFLIFSGKFNHVFINVFNFIF